MGGRGEGGSDGGSGEGGTVGGIGDGGCRGGNGDGGGNRGRGEGEGARGGGEVGGDEGGKLHDPCGDARLRTKVAGSSDNAADSDASPMVTFSKKEPVAKAHPLRSAAIAVAETALEPDALSAQSIAPLAVTCITNPSADCALVSDAEPKVAVLVKAPTTYAPFAASVAIPWTAAVPLTLTVQSLTPMLVT